MTTRETAVPPRAELSQAKRALIETRLRGLHRAAGIARRDHGSTVPISSAQERLYFLDRLQPGLAAYNVAEAVRLSGGVDEAALERALGEVVRRHDVLRTTFREEDGVVVGVVAPFAGFRLPVDDLSALAPNAREAEALRRLAGENAHVFDLAAGPLFRFTLLRLGEGEHALLACMHHIVTDGWSTRVFFRELWALYGAYAAGRASPLDELPLQYADYAAWQREQAGGEAEARQLRYWKERLAGAPEGLDLPTDRPRPAVATFRGATVPVSLPLEAVDRLRALARAEGTTLYVVALAAWKALLARYGGGGDVVVGGVTAGRTRHELEGLVGLFVNTLVLRTRLDGDPAFRQAVGRVRECLLGACEHQDLPFERLVAELRPERSLGQSPLFQVMFLLNHVEEAAGAGADEIRTRSLDAELGVAKFDLTLELHVHGAGMSGTLEYATDLFDRETAARMAAHLQRLLAGAADDPDRRLSRLELMDAGERARVLEAWNATETPVAARCIHDLFGERVEAAPDAMAVVFRDQALTYRELDARANRLAHALVGRGAGPERRVGVCLERSAEWAVALLGVLRAGAAYVPLDPAYPPERLAFMLADCGASVLVTQQSLRPRLAAGIPVVSLDGDADALAALPASPPRTSVAPENAAYVIYTSGSTGRPKGVQVTHANAANLFAGMDARVGAVPGTWLAQASVSFDMHVVELLWTLVRGFRVVLLPAMDRAGRDETPAALLRHHGVTHFQCTPSLAAVMVAEAGVEAFAGLRRLLLGGEAMPAALAARLAEALPGVLLNMYGPTETTVWSAGHPMRAGEGAVLVGRPLANQRVHVLDAALGPCPIGVPGELYVAGAGVSRGYLDRPGLTAERFVPDPFAREPGARLYRTGDRGRWTADGLLQCLGRVDDQVKVHGFRIEPGEVEAALRTHPAVRECAVAAREERPGDARLAAWVVPAGEPATPEALRAHLEARLPRHMVPEAFVALDALPLSPNGKLDRRALPAPEARRAAREPGAPADALEARLIEIWEELLGVAAVGPTESFFDLGGSSILALRLFSRVNARLDCDLPVATLFTGATVRHMARAIREQRAAAGGPESPVVPLQPGGPLPPLFCVHTAGGQVMPYMNVVRHLGPEQPVYGLRDTGGDFSRPLARIATEYVRAIRTVQPRGPYYLAGWSFGGSVAFEMALQLQALGETTAFVGLIDTMSPVLVNEWPSGDADIVAGLAREFAEEAGQAFHVPPEALAGLDRDEQVRRVFSALRARGAAPAGMDEAGFAAECQLNRDRNASRASYVPGRFSGTLTLFRAADLPEHVRAFMAGYGERDRHDLGWTPFTDRPVEVHPVPGNHNTVGAEPHVRVLVDRLRQSLASARRRAGHASPLPS